MSCTHEGCGEMSPPGRPCPEHEINPAGDFPDDAFETPRVGTHLGRLELRDAVIEKNAVGHYYIVGYLPGGIRVAGWLHERPLPTAKEGENGPPA